MRLKPQIKLFTLWVLDSSHENQLGDTNSEYYISRGIWETFGVKETERGRFYTMRCVISHVKSLEVGKLMEMHEDSIIHLCHQIKIIHLPKINEAVDMKKGKWYPLEICSKCSVRIRYDDRHHNGGVCPHCGYNSKSTTCSTDTVVIRKIKHDKPWWMIWKKRKITFEGKDELSNKWLLTLDDD